MIPSFSRVRSIRARVATVVPIPTSKRLTVLAETPADVEVEMITPEKIWEANIETLRILHRSSDERPGVVPTMVGHLRSCAISLVKSANGEHACHQTDRNAVPRQKIEKAAEEMEVSVRT